MSVGLIGYPNTGKSSIINTLRGKKVATIAPIPGETKVWQYVTLMKRIYLIDCPGIVPQNHHDAPTDLLLRGVVRVENVEHPEQYIPAVLSRVKKHHMARTYGLTDWNDDHIQFLEALARKGGRLLKGGEPDVDGVAKMILNDFMRGKIPWFIPAPDVDRAGQEESEVGEVAAKEAPKKRKRAAVEEEEKAPEVQEEDSSPAVDVDETFHGFDDDSAPEISDDSDSEAADEDADEDADQDEDVKDDAAATESEAPAPQSDAEEEGGAPVVEEKVEEVIEEAPTPRRSSRRLKKS